MHQVVRRVTPWSRLAFAGPGNPAICVSDIRTATSLSLTLTPKLRVSSAGTR